MWIRITGLLGLEETIGLHLVCPCEWPQSFVTPVTSVGCKLQQLLLSSTLHPIASSPLAFSHHQEQLSQLLSTVRAEQ